MASHALDKALHRHFNDLNNKHSIVIYTKLTIY